MGRRCTLAAALLGTLALLCGCAWIGRPPPLAAAPVELDATPFFPQREYMCGPAALATVLGASGVDTHPDRLAPGLYLPERRGTLQLELLGAARRLERLPVRVDGTLQAVVAQLEAGRPVLVLQNLALRAWPVWHYAVVVGYQPGRERLVLRSGGERREVVSRRRFEASWARAERWAIVVLAPHETPTGLAPDAYLKAAAALESTGAHRAALRAFQTAERTWPDQPTAALGTANNHYLLGDAARAERAYRTLLAAHPGQVAALHNLAALLAEQGRGCAARAVLERHAELTGELVERARRAADAAPCRDGG